MRLSETCAPPGPVGSILLVLRSGFSRVQKQSQKLNCQTSGLFRCTTARSIESAVGIPHSEGAAEAKG